jgi:uncharacterized protein (DUF58 family)
VTTPIPPSVRAPLLGAAEIAALATLGAQGLPLAAQREVHDHHAGDWPSARLGRGLDFEEARPYAPGDDVRDMDWRSTARLGHPYVKIYREERQPTWHLVLDRGPTMRFGTRRRLKVTQAARLALLVAFHANERNATVGATLWDEPDLQIDARHGRTAILTLAQTLVTACPPPSLDPPGVVPTAQATEAERDRQRLQTLATELPRGSRVWLLSDFAWLAPAHATALARLAQHTELRAVRISDPAEHALPDLGRVRFDDIAHRRPRWIDTRGTRARTAYAQAQAEARARQDAVFARCGLRPVDLGTPVDDLIAGMPWHG